jgi:hypothetical protein
LLNKLNKEALIKDVKEIGLEKHLMLIINIFNKYSEEKIFHKDKLLLDFSIEKREEILCCESLMINRQLGNEFISIFLTNSLSELLKASMTFFASKSKIEHKYSLVSKKNSVWKFQFIRLKQILILSFRQVLKIKFPSNVFKEIRALRKINKLVS